MASGVGLSSMLVKFSMIHVQYRVGFYHWLVDFNDACPVTCLLLPMATRFELDSTSVVLETLLE